MPGGTGKLPLYSVKVVKLNIRNGVDGDAQSRTEKNKSKRQSKNLDFLHFFFFCCCFVAFLK